MSKPKDPTPESICTACGGSGVSFKPLGPFLTSVQKRWREMVEAHIGARHEVFEKLDQEVARQVIPLAKAFEKADVTVSDMLIESAGAADDAAKAWRKGEFGEAFRALLKVAVTTVYVLESLEITSKRVDEEPEK